MQTANASSKKVAGFLAVEMTVASVSSPHTSSVIHMPAMRTLSFVPSRSMASFSVTWRPQLPSWAETPQLSGWAAALLDRANFTGLVLGCIEAKVCKKICVGIGKLSPRSTQCTPLHRSQCSKFSSKIAEIFANFFTKCCQISYEFAKFSLDFG